MSELVKTLRKRKLVTALKLAGGAGAHGYPGCEYCWSPKKYNTLEKMGLVKLWQPHNPVHKERMILTHEGQEALNAIEGKS